MGPPYYEPATRNGPLRSPINAKRGYDYFQAEAVVVQMEIKRWSLVAVVIGMVNVMLLVEGCLEEERIALLQIKTSFYSPNGLSSQYYSWGKDANCCNWEGVYCSVTTGRVVTLDLIIKRLEDWYLNATLFLPFQELNSLDLSGNNILGCVQNEGFEILSKLDNLEDLYLSSNKFNNSILTSLSALSSLKSLFLSGNRLKGSINIEELNSLRSLESLNLEDNEIEGFKSFHGGEALLELSNLEVLSLGENRFNNSILQSLKSLLFLQLLDLSDNQLKGSFNMKELDALINLKSVVLDGNKIDKFMFAKDSRGFPNLSSLYLYNMTTNGRSIPFSLLQSLAKFANLRTLVLGWNHFDGTILAQALLSLKNLEELEVVSCTLGNIFLEKVGKITTLKALYLIGCGLNGTIPTAQGLCELKHLQTLGIGYNDLNGTLPWCLSNLTSLQFLDVSSNHFTGDISSSPLVSLTSLQYLYLSDNHFQIPISLNHFFNHSKLKFFSGANNEIYVEELKEHNLTPKFQLEKLNLSGHGHGGAFPKFLFYQFNLQIIDFSNSKLRGGFPNWLLDNNTNLDQFYLANNSLSGPFQLPIHPHVKLSKLDISHNYFDSHIPIEIGAYFPSLTFLFMSGNHFSGSIPSSIGTMLHLQILDMSKNNISGTLPSCFSFLPLIHLYLSHNTLQGNLEDAFRNSFELVTLDLSHNGLSGSIPEWIGQIYKLSFLLLGHNNLEGRLPFQLCKLDELGFIDLSHNNFSGHILPCLRYKSSFWFLQLTTNSYAFEPKQPLEITTKSISYSYPPSVLKYMSGLDLSCNNLEGNIPQEIGNLNNIHTLNLSNNHLLGPIPQTFSNLSQVESLDLSNNNLTGKIPLQLVEMHSLAFFSVADNNLSGKTPDMVAQFSTFNKSSYEGNPFLCGPPLSKRCTQEEEAPSSLPRNSTDNIEESGFIDTFTFYVSFGVTYIMVLLGIAAVLYINPRWRQVWFYFIEEIINKCYYFLVDNLLKRFGVRGWKPLV